LSIDKEYTLIDVVNSLVKQLGSGLLAQDAVIDWAAPVPSFGNYETAGIATVGINPSNLEFVDSAGAELLGNERRFPSLGSMGISSWNNVREKDVLEIAEACELYFHRNPYYQWFNQLDFLLTGTGHSYYNHVGTACHLDLVPFATFQKWSSLSIDTKERLKDESRSTLSKMIENCGARFLILNGQQVVNEYEKITGETLEAVVMKDWSLPRKSGTAVCGKAYKHVLEISRGKKIIILGYNHNIQSSFGVTKDVKARIRDWITEQWNCRTE
jgi:hypothetical protein